MRCRSPSAWPLVPLRSAADAALVRNGSGANAVASADALPARVYSLRIVLALVVAPASMTPRPSITQRLARATASDGNSGHRARLMKPTTSRVTVVAGTGHIMCAGGTHGNRAFVDLGAVIGAAQWETYRYFSSPASASSSTRASSRTRGEISPSLTAVATVTGLVRSSQTVAAASTTLTIAMRPNRLTPRGCNRITPRAQSFRSVRTPPAAAVRQPHGRAETSGR